MLTKHFSNDICNNQKQLSRSPRCIMAMQVLQELDFVTCNRSQLIQTHDEHGDGGRSGSSNSDWLLRDGLMQLAIYEMLTS